MGGGGNVMRGMALSSLRSRLWPWVKKWSPGLVFAPFFLLLFLSFSFEGESEFYDEAGRAGLVSPSEHDIQAASTESAGGGFSFLLLGLEKSGQGFSATNSNGDVEVSQDSPKGAGDSDPESAPSRIVACNDPTVEEEQATLYTATRSTAAPPNASSGLIICFPQPPPPRGHCMTVDFGLSEPGLLRLASNAFRMHGAFRVVPKGKGAIRFEFTTAGEGVVNVEIIEGKTGRRLLNKEFAAPSILEAFYRASDAAVLATTDAPGFFSGKLTYVSKGARGKGKELFVADALFNRAQAKTNFGTFCFNASWSADGQGVFFTSDKSRFNNVYYMDFAAGDVQTVARFRGSNLSGVQSPDGRAIAYVLSATGNPEIWLGGRIGGKLRRVTSNKSNESGPCWSPDGSRLVVTSDTSGKPGLYEVSLDTGKLSRIPVQVGGACSEAAWNPRDPERIAFTTYFAGRFMIAEHNLATGKTRFLIRGHFDSLQPEWANDGRHLFFTEQREESTRLMILDTKEDGRQTAIPLHSEKFGNCSQASFHYPSSTE